MHAAVFAVPQGTASLLGLAHLELALQQHFGAPSFAALGLPAPATQGLQPPSRPHRQQGPAQLTGVHAPPHGHVCAPSLLAAVAADAQVAAAVATGSALGRHALADHLGGNVEEAGACGWGPELPRLQVGCHLCVHDFAPLSCVLVSLLCMLQLLCACLQPLSFHSFGCPGHFHVADGTTYLLLLTGHTRALCHVQL